MSENLELLSVASFITLILFASSRGECALFGVFFRICLTAQGMSGSKDIYFTFVLNRVCAFTTITFSPSTGTE